MILLFKCKTYRNHCHATNKIANRLSKIKTFWLLYRKTKTLVEKKYVFYDALHKLSFITIKYDFFILNWRVSYLSTRSGSFLLISNSNFYLNCGSVIKFIYSRREKDRNLWVNGFHGAINLILCRSVKSMFKCKSWTKPFMSFIVRICKAYYVRSCLRKIRLHHHKI